MHSITWPCTLFNNHPYISSSKVPLVLLLILLTYLYLLCMHMVSNSQYVLSPQSSLQESARVSPSYVQSKAQKADLQRISLLRIGGCFTRYTYRVTVLGCLKKLRRKTELLTFDRFRLATLKIVTIHVAITMLQTGAGSISCSMYF